MRVLFILMMCICSISAFTQKICSQVDSVVIKYAPWDLETDIGIDCINYESCIAYKIYSESDSRVLGKLMKELNRLSMSPKSGDDIRCKLDFFLGDSICQTICVSEQLTKIESNYYDTSLKLKSIIERIIEAKREFGKTEDLSWSPDSCIRQFYQSLSNNSGRLYNNLVIEYDLNFMVLCNIYGGKTVGVRFSKDKNLDKSNIPEQIISVIKEILFHEIGWDTPPNYGAKWIPIHITIKANKQIVQENTE